MILSLLARLFLGFFRSVDSSFSLFLGWEVSVDDRVSFVQSYSLAYIAVLEALNGFHFLTWNLAFFMSHMLFVAIFFLSRMYLI